MAFLFESAYYDLTLLVVLLITCVYWFFTSTFNYWKERGVPYVKPFPFVGNLERMYTSGEGLNGVYNSIYRELKGHKFGGYFEIKSPVLLVRDPQLVERILIKDFYHFYNRGLISNREHIDPLSANLFSLENLSWRNLRYKLTPTFTSGKLKGMFEQINNCADELIQNIEEEVKINKAVEGKPMFSNFAFEVIGTVAFGLQLDKDSESSKAFRKIINFMITPNKLQLLRFFSLLYAPNIANKLEIKQFPPEMEGIIMHLVKETMNYRSEKKLTRNDFFQLLLNLRKQEKEGTLKFHRDLDHIPEEDDVIDQMEYASIGDGAEDVTNAQNEVFMTDGRIAAQSLIFLTAGSESVSTTVNFTLFSLSKNQHIQNKVHQEIDSVLQNYDNKWCYQAVKDLTYLDQVIQESLRFYPVAPVLFRVCTEPYKIPDTNLVIEKGIRVIIPVRSIHNDPDNYDNPEVFDPTRFEGNNFKPSGSYMPFGDGPRICIAMRFAVLEVKIALAKLLSQYTVKLNDKTKLPVTFKKNTFLLLPENPIYFEFEKRVKN